MTIAVQLGARALQIRVVLIADAVAAGPFGRLVTGAGAGRRIIFSAGRQGQEQGLILLLAFAAQKQRLLLLVAARAGLEFAQQLRRFVFIL